MRTMFVSAAIVILALTGCATPASDGPTDDGPGGPGTVGGEAVDVRGEWSFIGGSDADGPLEVSAFPLTVEFADGNARIRTGCFSFDQPLNPELEVVTIGLTSHPQAACMALSEDETAAIESLAEVTDADRVADELVLYSGDYELEFALVPAVPVDDVVGTWSLGSILWGDTAMVVPAGPTITLTADGKLNGSTGCAAFTGSYEVLSGTNTIADLAIDQAACTEDLAVVDGYVREVLDGGFLIHVSDGALSLVASKSETTLVYDPAA